MASLSISKTNQAWGAVALITIAAATAPVFIRFAQHEGVPSLSIVSLRLILGTLLLTPFAWQRHGSALRHMSRQDWLWAIAAGALHAFGLFCLFFALENTSILVNSVLRRTSPLWTIGLEMVLLHAVFTRRVWVGIAITLLGSGIVAFGGAVMLDVGQRPLLGAGLSLLNAIMLSGYLVIGRKLRHKLPFLAYTWVLFAAAALVATLMVAITHTPLTGYTPIGYLWVIVITIIAQLSGHLPMNFAVRHFPATTLSVMLQLSVAASAVIAFLIFNEIPTWMQIIGSGIIIFGIWLVTWRR